MYGTMANDYYRGKCRLWEEGAAGSENHVSDAAERQLSAAPLAGVGSVEDVGERQLPGNARAADPWNEGDVRVSQPSGGCGLSIRQQAGAFCRVNRAQPRGRASGRQLHSLVGPPGYRI